MLKVKQMTPDERRAFYDAEYINSLCDRAHCGDEGRGAKIEAARQEALSSLDVEGLKRALQAIPRLDTLEGIRATLEDHEKRLVTLESIRAQPQPSVDVDGDFLGANPTQTDRAKTNIERAIEENGKAEPKVSYDEPPVEIVDLVDPDLTARQNLDVLIQKHTVAKHLEEMARSHGDTTAAMKHLKDAERFESGITWNRAVLAEVV